MVGGAGISVFGDEDGTTFVEGVEKVCVTAAGNALNPKNNFGRHGSGQVEDSK